MSSSRLRQPAPRMSMGQHSSERQQGLARAQHETSSWSAAPPNTPVVHGGAKERALGRTREAAGRTRAPEARREDRYDDGHAKTTMYASPRAFLAPAAPPNTPSSSSAARPSQLPRRSQAQPGPLIHHHPRAHVARTGSIRKRASVRRPAGAIPTRGGERRGAGSSSTVGQVGSSSTSYGRSRIPETPLTGRERLRPTSYHQPPSNDARGHRARGPILEPPASYHSRRHPQSGPSAIPTRRSSIRYRSAASSSAHQHRPRGPPSTAATPYLSPRLPSGAKRPQLRHLSSSESLLRVTMPTAAPSNFRKAVPATGGGALGLTHRPQERERRRPSRAATHSSGEAEESSAGSSGPDEAKLLWAELERRLAPPEEFYDEQESEEPDGGWSKQWVRERERQRDIRAGPGVSLAGLMLDEARRLSSPSAAAQYNEEDGSLLLRPPSYPSADSFDTAAHWSPHATVGSPTTISPLAHPRSTPTRQSLSPLPPHSPCPQMLHPSPRALPAMRSPLLDPEFTYFPIASTPAAPVAVGMERLDSHVARTMRQLEEVWVGESPLMQGRPLEGVWDARFEDAEDEEKEREEARRRSVWEESYRRTGRWRASVSEAVGEPADEESGRAMAAVDGGLGRTETESPVPLEEATTVEKKATTELDLELDMVDIKFIGLGLLSGDTSDETALVPSLGFGTNPGGTRSRLSTLTNSSYTASASSSRTNSSLGVPQPGSSASTRSSSLLSSSSSSAAAGERVTSPLLPSKLDTIPSSPQIPNSPLLSLPTPDLGLQTSPAFGSPAPGGGGLRPLSLPIKYNLAPASPVVGSFEEANRRASLGSSIGVGARRKVSGGGGNRDWRVLGGEMGEGEAREVRVWK